MGANDRTDSLHTKPSDSSETVILVIDVINPFEFDDWDQVVDRAEAIGPSIAMLKERARKAKIPAIYVNDNFGQWKSNSERLVEYCKRQGNARDLVNRLNPQPDDYFVLKPMHSGFFETPLSLLLRALGAHRLILTGLWTNSCVLFTAHDAYMRDFELSIPEDCVAARSEDDQRYGLNQMRTVLKAEITLGKDVSLNR